MELSFEFTQEQRARNLPRLIEANYLLHLSAPELQTLIANELHENPALEIAEDAICHTCGTPLENGRCLNCAPPMESPEPRIAEDPQSWSDLPTRSMVDEEDYDPLGGITAYLDRREDVASDLRTVLPPGHERLAEVLAESLDERGFLTLSEEELAAMADCDVATVTEAIALLQEIESPGVGARDLRESLLLQLRFLQEHGVEVPDVVEALVENHLDDLAAHRYQRLARTLRVDIAAIAEAHEFIRDQLSPQPWSQERNQGGAAVSEVTFVRPDVVISITPEDELTIKVAGGIDRGLKINSLYQELANSLRSRSNCQLESEDDRGHVRESVVRARQFLSKLQQRRETLERISLCTVSMQEAFIRHGVRELKPLTRASVANQLGVHESTVSRAIAGKYAMLPNSKVVPLSTFFTASLSTKDAITQIIREESERGVALADREIVQRLLEQGYRVARRTVAKYRAELGILPSTVR